MCQAEGYNEILQNNQLYSGYSAVRLPGFYPAFLATFPLSYWAFAIYASDYDVLANEMLVGVGFLVKNRKWRKHFMRWHSNH